MDIQVGMQEEEQMEHQVRGEEIRRNHKWMEC